MQNIQKDHYVCHCKKISVKLIQGKNLGHQSSAGPFQSLSEVVIQRLFEDSAATVTLHLHI